LSAALTQLSVLITCDVQIIVIASEQRELEPSLHEMGGSAAALRSNAVMLLVHRLDRWRVYFVAVEIDSGGFTGHCQHGCISCVGPGSFVE